MHIPLHVWHLSPKTTFYPSYSRTIFHYSLRRKAVEAAIHSTGGLRGRDQRLAEWKSKAYNLSNAEARALSTRLLDGKEVCVIAST